MKKRPEVEYTAGSAFHALKLPNAGELKLKADLIQCVADIVAARKLTRAEAGALVGMEEPRISALLGGKITRLSIERLVRALNALGQDVEVRVKPSRRPRGTTLVKTAA